MAHKREGRKVCSSESDDSNAAKAAKGLGGRNGRLVWGKLWYE
jgi:hypothetical protein